MNSGSNNLIEISDLVQNFPAILSKDFKITYNKLDKLSSAFANSIYSLVREQKYIGLFLDNSPEFILSVLALWKLGVVPVPLNLIAADKELISQITTAEISLIISNHSYLQKLEAIKSFSSKEIKTINYVINSLDDKEHTRELDFQPLLTSKSTANNEAVVIFTSGATGEPKGVVHTFHSLSSSIVNGNEILNHQPGDRWLASLPFYHIGGFQIICRALYRKTAIILPNSLQTEAISEAITEFNPTHASFVSTQLKRLLDNKINPNNELRCSLIGGGFTDKNLLLNAKESGWHPVKVYGSSETASFVSALCENNLEEKGFSAGKPVGNNRIIILDENGEECSIQIEGEIIFKSESLFKYYLNNDSETISKLKHGSYFTGDLGYIDDDGFLFITGRKNEMIVTGGKNVNPIEVESAILKYPGIVEAAVFPINDVEWGEIVCAAIVTSVKIDTNSLIIFLKKEISSYKVPKKIFIEDSLPRTAMGKIERMKLKEKYNSKQ